MFTEINSIRYGDKVLAVEPYGAEALVSNERHGKPRNQFTLWLGCNLTIADYALGFVPVSLGLSWTWAVAAILVGNLLGAAVLAACAAMGPSYGAPQMIISRFMFGRVGGYLPALLNYVSTIGWFTVNNVLGSFGLQVLFPRLAFWQGAVILVVIQGMLAVYGHNLIHVYERVMAVVLGVVFAVATVIALSHHVALSAYHPSTAHPWAMFAIMVAAAFSYIGSWSPYASDYSRYLPVQTSRRAIFGWAFLGAFVASVWLELVGTAVAVLAGPHSGNSISALHSVMGAFGVISVIAIILGGTAADALNLYSNALSAGALDIRLPRWALTIIAAVAGLVLSLLGSGAFEANYENFLLLLGYWMTPWIAVLLVDFFINGMGHRVGADNRHKSVVVWPGFVSFVVGLVASMPFMSSTLYTGPVAAALHGGDLAFYVGFVVSGLVYLGLTRRGVGRIARRGGTDVPRV